MKAKKSSIVAPLKFNCLPPGVFSDEELRLVACRVPRLATDAEYIQYASVLSKILGVRKIYREKIFLEERGYAAQHDGSSTTRPSLAVIALDALYSEALSNFMTGFKNAAGSDRQALAVKIAVTLGLGRLEIETLNALASGLFYPNGRFEPFKLDYKLSELADHLDLAPQDALYLSSGECGLVRGRIYEVSMTKHAGNLFDKYFICPSIECLKAICGYGLSCDELLRLDGSPLEKLILANINRVGTLPPAEHAAAENPDEGSNNNSAAPEGDSLIPEPSELEAAACVTELSPAGETPCAALSVAPDAVTNAVAETNPGPLKRDDDLLLPYATDGEYVKDLFEWLKVRAKYIEAVNPTANRYMPVVENDNSVLQINELCRNHSVKFNKLKRRLDITRSAGSFVPKFERYCETYCLDENERLIFAAILYHVHKDDDPRADSLLNFLSGGFEERIKFSRYFYCNCNLVKSGLIRIDEDYRRRSCRFEIEIDRHIYNDIIGLKFEMDEILAGSNLYRPATRFEDVILPEQVKETVKTTVTNLPKMQEIIKKRVEKGTDYYGTGSVMLFYGPSGTGKTMLANAVANYMNKNLLLVNFSRLDDRGDRALRAIFREARLNDAIVFFDECDALLSDRYWNNEFSSIMTELERHDGFAILATNVPERLDEAARRRIMLSVEFHKPDYNMREKIWRREVPEKIRTADDIDWRYLAFNFELTGGLIKNAVRNAILSALERDQNDPVITAADLDAAAKNQLKVNFSGANLKNMIAPSSGLDKFIAPPDIIETLKSIIESEKNKNILFGQWGFGENESDKRGYGTTVLLYGAPGTGKTYCTEVLGYELGKPIMKVNLAQMLSCWVGETGKNIQAIFEDAQSRDAILLFDEADALFAGRGRVSSSTDRYANSDVNLILQEIENFRGVAVLTTNLIDNLDGALFRRIKHAIRFDLPDAKLREQLWRSLIPPRAPLAPDVDFRRIAEKYAVSGAVIKKAIFTAAGIAAARFGTGEAVITAEDICRALDREHIPESARFKKIGFEAAA